MGAGDISCQHYGLKTKRKEGCGISIFPYFVYVWLFMLNRCSATGSFGWFHKLFLLPTYDGAIWGGNRQWIYMILFYSANADKNGFSVSSTDWNLLNSQQSRHSIRWLWSCDKSSYIRSVYIEGHVDWLKCSQQNVNKQSLTQISQLYIHVYLCLKVIRSWLNLPTGWCTWWWDLHGWVCIVRTWNMHKTFCV